MKRSLGLLSVAAVAIGLLVGFIQQPEPPTVPSECEISKEGSWFIPDVPECNCAGPGSKQVYVHLWYAEYIQYHGTCSGGYCDITVHNGEGSGTSQRLITIAQGYCLVRVNYRQAGSEGAIPCVDSGVCPSVIRTITGVDNVSPVFEPCT